MKMKLKAKTLGFLMQKKIHCDENLSAIQVPIIIYLIVHIVLKHKCYSVYKSKREREASYFKFFKNKTNTHTLDILLPSSVILFLY